MLLIGAVIIPSQTNAFEDRVYEIHIAGVCIERGREVKKRIVTYTDDQGYFILENVPSGQYALVGVRTGEGSGILIWNDWHLPNEKWISMRHSEIPAFTGSYWAWKPRLGVYNFGYNIFVWGSWNVNRGEIHYYNRARVDGESFVYSKAYHRPYVEEYLLQRYPESGWAPILRQLISR